jgi:hypothetical protein
MLVLDTQSFLEKLNSITEGLQNGEKERREEAIEWFAQMKCFHRRDIDDIICFAWEDYYDWEGPDEEMKKAWDELEKNPAFEIVYRYYSGRLYEIQSALMNIFGIDFKEL